MTILLKTRLALLMFAVSVVEFLFSIFKVLLAFVAIFLSWSSSIEGLAELDKFMKKSLYQVLKEAKTR